MTRYDVTRYISHGIAKGIGFRAAGKVGTIPNNTPCRTSSQDYWQKCCC